MTRTGDREIRSGSGRLPDNPGELAYVYMHRNYTVLCVSVSNTCCDLCFVSFCFCVLLDGECR